MRQNLVDEAAFHVAHVIFTGLVEDVFFLAMDTMVCMPLLFTLANSLGNNHAVILWVATWRQISLYS